MLVELAVGDAYGAGFEYVAADEVATGNTLRGYVRHPRHHGLHPGDYTDDTQQSLAIAELLVSGQAWTRREVAARLVEVFHRDPREGYARGFAGLLRGVGDGDELLRLIRPHSDKSGAAMRAGPIGLLPTVADVVHHARLQARITHDTPSGVEGAVAAALAVHYCHADLGPVPEIGAWVERQVLAGGGSGGWAVPWEGPVGAKATMSVRAALTAIAGGDRLSEILRTCVAFTGDVDTVATIALAAASRSPRIARDLPAALVRGLENGPYGRAYLWRLDAQLLSAVSPPASAASLLGTWDDGSLYLGAMESDGVAFLPDGTGWFEHANALATEREPFSWRAEGSGRIVVHRQSGEDSAFSVRTGRGTNALDEDVRILTMTGSGGEQRRYAPCLDH
ncbi:ADP-ribosylglycohydrolase family protein [Saccharomonospora sp. NPDC006951]